VLPVSAINRLDVADEDHQLPEQKWPLPPPVSSHNSPGRSSDEIYLSMNAEAHGLANIESECHGDSHRSWSQIATAL
jgi:hypothetical protein